MDQLLFISRKKSKHLRSIIHKAEEGSLEAQYVCWETFFLHVNSDPYLPPDPQLMSYVAPVLSKAYCENVKIESLLPFYKDREKYKKIINKLFLICEYIRTIENIIVVNNCTRGEAEQRLVDIVNRAWASNADPIKKAPLKTIFTLDKLKNELRYYDKHYPDWAFYLDGVEIGGLSFKPRKKGKLSAQIESYLPKLNFFTTPDSNDPIVQSFTYHHN